VRGVASSHAAISVVNAVPLGIGAAIGIDWPARATADLEPNRGRNSLVSVKPRGSGSTVVRAAARAALGRFAPGWTGRLRLEIRSTIPVARGLKSSSAVGSSVILATARAAAASPSAVEVARVCAEVGRATGMSATGAFDDAVAGLTAGGVVTDNRRDEELCRFAVDPDLGVALWVPDRRHPRSPLLRQRFRRNPALAQRAVDAALEGDWARAMEANSALVEAAMGYRYARLHEAAARAGAVAAGVSGMGPAFAALAPGRRLRAVVASLPRQGRRRAVRLLAEPGSRRNLT